MTSEWILVSIDEIKAPRPGSIAIGPFGSRMKSDCYVRSGVRVVRGTNLTGGRTFSGEFVCISPEKATELNSANLQADDLVFPHRGSIGEVGIVPEDGNRYVISSSLMKLTCDVNKAWPDFIYYYFKSEKGKFELLKNASQVGTPGIGQPLSSLKQIQLRLPSLLEQTGVASLLRALDDRIALLREANATLEAIAQAVFKSWFIDFDPVRAKQRGLTPAGVDEVIAAIFPDSFVEAPSGLTPSGWRLGSVRDFARQHRQSINPLDHPERIYEHFSLPAFDKGKLPIIEAGSEIKSNKTTVPTNSVLLSKLNPHIPRVWMPVDAGDYAISSTEFLVFTPEGEASKEFFYCALSTPHFQERLCQLVTGTSNSHQRVKADGILDMPSVVPPPAALKAFYALASPLFVKIGGNRQQAQSLVALRDTLLPRLISGQLRLPQAEALLEEATA